MLDQTFTQQTNERKGEIHMSRNFPEHPNLDRRRFLKTTGASLASLIAIGLLPLKMIPLN